MADYGGILSDHLAHRSGTFLDPAATSTLVSHTLTLTPDLRTPRTFVNRPFSMTRQHSQSGNIQDKDVLRTSNTDDELLFNSVTVDQNPNGSHVATANA